MKYRCSPEEIRREAGFDALFDVCSFALFDTSQRRRRNIRTVIL